MQVDCQPNNNRHSEVIHIYQFNLSVKTTFEIDAKTISTLFFKGRVLSKISMAKIVPLFLFF